MTARHLLAAPAAVHLSATGSVLGTGRTVPTLAALLAVVGLVVGGLALARSADRVGPVSRRAAALVGLVLGPLGAVVGGLHAANAAGGLGTGNGLAGAVAALVLGLAGTVVAGAALARCRRTV
ncbi:DUF6223 family protein [Pseudonocardia kujensis]|uniref:DUF6223 family protein n=1 Tax=Pseudonocardia kujensis TaxID=1128675 RepID=UPI001E3C3625|nr:DUF6223 family protein [Pseudonocardia kujensis]MCE0762762.1 DUF6223 family protein [Pseudonocardia kujensis]